MDKFEREITKALIDLIFTALNDVLKEDKSLLKKEDEVYLKACLKTAEEAEDYEKCIVIMNKLKNLET
jgi:hypothetical protein